MNLRIVAIIVFALACSGCCCVGKKPSTSNYSEADEIKRVHLIGKWMGQVDKPPGTRWVNHRDEDGTYLITFENPLPDGNIQYAQEYGIWGIAGNIYFTKMLGRIENGFRVPASNALSYYDEAYSIISLTETAFKYRSVKTGKIFEVKKVSSDFELKP